ncbi:hypothetical protein DBL07_02240 [Achromobacter mucicolens]|uniref:hypothetical protein n=1 Tax=Achromobacter mucicolens TaxID=1389922 RepID=UPI0007C8727A|nr:hypothetical protein [Achromobacter mucicolens]OAE50034.1 hypothetical protein A7J67_04360 [Achromobacter xylosoxidans]PTX10590.1 hypothetical protein DBL07_02240 [Achromobacter mucicolens]
MVPQRAGSWEECEIGQLAGTGFAVRVIGHDLLAEAHPEVTKMEPQHSVGQASSQDNPVEATSTPDDLPVRPADGTPGAQPVNPSDASENAQGNEVRNEDMEPSDASESNPDPADSQRSS